MFNKKLSNRKSVDKYIRNKPWLSSYFRAKSRCENPKSFGYKYYGCKGIKFLMTMEDFKYLWFRDKAYEMKQPSIDREKSDRNYEISNCKFMELKDNSLKTHAGINNSHAKLNPIKVLEIRKKYGQGLSKKELSRMYCVTTQCIGQVVNNKTWRCICG